MSTAPQFDPNEAFPWESTPDPTGSKMTSAVSHGVHVDPVRNHPLVPFPDPATGALLVDPDIFLRAKGFNLEINLFYNSRSAADGAFGKKRSLSTNCFVNKIVDSGTFGQVVRGDEKLYQFTAGSTVGGVTTYNPSANQYAGTSLVFDSNVPAFIETFPDGMKLVYSKDLGGGDKWGLGKIEDASGNIHTYSWGTGSEANLLKSIEVPGGRLCTMLYMPSGASVSLLNAIQDWGDRRWTMQYDAGRQLTTLTTPLGCSTKYSYASNFLNVIEDNRGFATTFAFDAQGRVASMAAGSGIWNYGYGGVGPGWSGSTQTDPNGAVTTYLLDALGRVINIQRSEGYTSTYTYDGNGYRTKTVEPYGTVHSTSYNAKGRPLINYDALGNVTTLQYDNDFNLTTQIDALGNIWSFTWDGSRRMTAKIDPLGRRTTNVWNSDGTLQAVVDGRGLRTTNMWDAYGNLASVLFSSGAVITYGYDEFNRRTSEFRPGDIGARSFLFDVGDNLIATVDLNGARTSYIWDSCLQVAYVNPLNERTTYGYNRFRSEVSEMDPLGRVRTSSFDSANRLVGTTDPLGNSTTIEYTLNQKTAALDEMGYRTEYAYDLGGRLSTVVDARENAWGNIYNGRDLIARVDPLGNVSTVVFDALGRVSQSISPLGLTSVRVFDQAGQLIAAVDPMGFRTSYTYDEAGNQRSIQDANGKLTTTSYFSDRNLPEFTQDAMGYRTTNLFDLQNRLMHRQDANGGLVTNLYDTVGRLQFVRNQLGEYCRQYGYDLAGRVVTFADAGNRLKTNTFDASGQNVQTQFPDGLLVTSIYDRAGRRTTMVDWGGTTTYAFDPRGLEIGKTDANGFVQTKGYDPNGNRTTLVLGGLGNFTYTFDELNRLATAQKPGNELYTIQYDFDSRRTTMLLGLGSRRQYQYDPNSRLTTLIELNTSNVQIHTIVDGYDPVGTRITRNLNGTPITWTYDDLYRLTGQLKTGQVCTYTMDGVGNLLTMWEGGNFPKTLTHNAADRLVTMVQGSNLTTYAYTNFLALETQVTGNQTTSYSYSGQDQLVGEVLSNGARSTYSFDGDGLRRTAHEQQANAKTTFVWDGSDYLYMQGPTNQTVLTLDSEIVHSSGKDLLTDPLGTLVREISAGASLSGAVSFFPYGTPIFTPFALAVPFQFVGAWGYFKDTNDRDYVRARELLVSVGGWMQLDAIWPRMRAYGYTSSPLLVIDPTGLETNFLGCDGKEKEKLQKARNSICNKLKKKKEYESCLGKCLGKCTVKSFDPGPEPPFFKCMEAWCESGYIICSECDKKNEPGLCSQSSHDTGPCNITICDAFWTFPKCPGTYTKHGSDSIEYALLHEITHCCSQDPFSGEIREPLGDALALCLAVNCNGLTLPFTETIYHVPVPKKGFK